MTGRLPGPELQIDGVETRDHGLPQSPHPQGGDLHDLV